MIMADQDTQRFLSRVNYQWTRVAQHFEKQFNEKHIQYDKSAGGLLLVPNIVNLTPTTEKSDNPVFMLKDAGNLTYNPTITLQHVFRLQFTRDELEKIYNSEFLTDYVFKTLLTSLSNTLRVTQFITPEDTTIGKTRGTFFDTSNPGEAVIVNYTTENKFELRLYSNCQRFNF